MSNNRTARSGQFGTVMLHGDSVYFQPGNGTDRNSTGHVTLQEIASISVSSPNLLNMAKFQVLRTYDATPDDALSVTLWGTDRNAFVGLRDDILRAKADLEAPPVISPPPSTGLPDHIQVRLDEINDAVRRGDISLALGEDLKADVMRNL